MDADLEQAVVDKAQEIIHKTREAFPGWSPPPYDPRIYARALGIEVTETREMPRWDALLVPTLLGFQILSNGNVRSAGRRSFSVAHELVHTFFEDARRTINTLSQLAECESLLGRHASALTVEHGLHIDGLDIEAGFVEIARKRCADLAEPPELVSGQAQQLPLPDDSVDRVIAAWVLGYMRSSKRETALAEALRVLRPGRERLQGCPQKREREGFGCVSKQVQAHVTGTPGTI